MAALILIVVAVAVVCGVVLYVYLDSVQAKAKATAEAAAVKAEADIKAVELKAVAAEIKAAVAIAKDVVADVHAATSGAAAAAVADKSTASNIFKTGSYFHAAVVAAGLIVVGMLILYGDAKVRRDQQPNSQYYPLSPTELLRRTYLRRYSGYPTREKRCFTAPAHHRSFDGKTAMFVNNGNVAWPKGTHLKRVASTADRTQTQLLDEGQSHYIGWPRPVRPNERVRFPLHINVPPKPFSNPATETLRLHDNDVGWFGKPVELYMTVT
jgi:hypothetical protein